MSIGERTQQRTDELRERLREEYGDCPVEEESVEVPVTRFEDMVGVAPEGLLDAGVAFVTDDEGRVLLVRTESGPERWTAPGDECEADESLEEAAVRAVREKAGVACEIDGLRLVRQLQYLPDDDEDERLLYTLDAFFAASAANGTPEDEGETPESGTSENDSEEALEARWFDEPPKTVDSLVEKYAEAW
ncbi:NUDIX domain-containing protein [Halegenticoccus soli]|uniref:NUDIX domain-containing protein n=1 Tax=Halegenticoccus soli TaxID=1985678 RepID=UPI0013042171|nr:NUDIX domain-containing protein [Halegenticoccus soli]